MRTFIFVIETQRDAPSSSAKGGRRPAGGSVAASGPAELQCGKTVAPAPQLAEAASTAARRMPSAVARRDISDITGWRVCQFTGAQEIAQAHTDEVGR